MADTPTADAATTAERKKADVLLAELEQAVSETKSPEEQIDAAVAIRMGRAAIKQFTDIVEEFERRAKEEAPHVESESRASREAKIAELKALVGL